MSPDSDPGPDVVCPRSGCGTHNRPGQPPMIEAIVIKGQPGYFCNCCALAWPAIGGVWKGLGQ